jgi:hypothetical protein
MDVAKTEVHTRSLVKHQPAYQHAIHDLHCRDADLEELPRDRCHAKMGEWLPSASNIYRASLFTKVIIVRSFVLVEAYPEPLWDLSRPKGQSVAGTRRQPLSYQAQQLHGGFPWSSLPSQVLYFVILFGAYKSLGPSTSLVRLEAKVVKMTVEGHGREVDTEKRVW